MVTDDDLQLALQVGTDVIEKPEHPSHSLSIAISVRHPLLLLDLRRVVRLRGLIEHQETWHGPRMSDEVVVQCQ
jgi:hypothetical protein